MREILFRGKRTDNSAWETGSLVVIWPGTSMETVFITDKSTGYQTKVDPSTVGQYTGLTDKNGKRIFEGDVVAYREYGNLAVVWDDGAFQLMREVYDTLDHYSTRFSVVIGNIYDNPELLGEVSDGNPKD